ncbi:MAG: hypothetical protein ABSF70_16415 [Terracidiphilus sp.]|jgi:hypothetical protein
MKSLRFVFIAIVFALPLSNAVAVYAQNICNKLTEDEVSAAVGAQLKRSPTNPCRFGRAFQSFSIIIHSGDGPRFGDYAANARKEFKDAQPVAGIGSDAIFFGGSLAVKAKGDVIYIQMLMGHSTDEKIRLSKVVVQKLLAHY